MSERTISNNTTQDRYELIEDGEIVGVVNYRIEETDTDDQKVMVIPHVEVAPRLRGHGVSGPFLSKVLAAVESEGYKVRPLCGYAAGYMRTKPELRAMMV